MKYFAASLFLTSGLALSSFAADPRANVREATRLTPAAFGGPPPEALAACSQADLNESCSVDPPRGSLEGTCRTPPGQSMLACVPEGGPPGRAAGAPPRMRDHQMIQTDGAPELIPATEDPIAPSEFSSTIEEGWRVIRANAISEHKTGMFPNAGNPNSISEQRIEVRVPAEPQLSDRAAPMPIGDFGYALNGVPFDPGAAEFWRGNPQLGWQYEALGGAVSLGLDENHAHVQPTGKYHYHGLPTLYLEDVALSSDAHSPLVGWAVDGFPVYALFGWQDASLPAGVVTELTTSYQLKSGNRPDGADGPGGVYDGTFVQDYEYVAGAGDLDECNGRITVTPDFPDGTYAYFLTDDWPVIPRCVKGEI